MAYWMELDGPGRVSIEMDPDRVENITKATWGRARRALGVPERIVVLDEVTAERVRDAVPPHVSVVVEEHPRVRAMANGAELPVEELFAGCFANTDVGRA